MFHTTDRHARRRLVSAAALLFVGFASGALMSSWLSGSVIPVRSVGQCAALDTDTGRLLGTFQSRDGRCSIRMWHLGHPFG